jgi:hypothetical protein
MKLISFKEEAFEILPKEFIVPSRPFHEFFSPRVKWEVN